jgi:uncharacterized membrane protein/mono/diheme cytochrome c family protein
MFDLSLLLARLHPALVHFPIALVLCGAGAQWWHLLRGRDGIAPSAYTMTALGALFGVLAAVSGWMAAFDGSPVEAGRGGEVLLKHRWIGIASAAFTFIALCLAGAARKQNTSGPFEIAFVVCITLAAVTTGITGHLGASLVWGERYITSVFDSPRVSQGWAPDRAGSGERDPSAPPSELPSLAVRTAPPGTVTTVNFETQIAPLFAKYCYECHGDQRSYGKLRLDTLEKLYKRPARFWVIQPGKPEESQLVSRIKAGPESDDRMPPVGEGLTGEEIELISTWIREGAWQRTQAAGS